jgi:hypothetical protein
MVRKLRWLHLEIIGSEVFGMQDIIYAHGWKLTLKGVAPSEACPYESIFQT